jgi:hypothetical protein
MVFLDIFILNLYFVILRFYQKKAQKEWFTFTQNNSTLNNIPNGVLNT